MTGDDGWDALWALTDSCMRASKIANRADRHDVKRTLAKVLMRKFAVEGLEVNQRNVSRALSETSRMARREFKTLTHFIPCHLSTDTERAGLSLGQIRFVSRAEAKCELREALKAERNDSSKEDRRDRQQMLQAISHYKGYRWYARVKVSDCAPKRSEAVALAAATSALDFLQLLIGTRNSHRMSVRGQPSHYRRMASIVRNEAGRLSISTGWSLLGASSLPAGWTEEIREGEGQAGLDQAGLILESRLNPDLERPLSLRLLDAVQWFGEAVRDQSPSTRLIKYVTALERLTLTKKPEDISECVSDRVAALVTGLIKDRSLEENKAAFKRVYGIRSALAHGSISPNDPKVQMFLGEACDASEKALRRALYNWPVSALSDTKFKVDDLDGWFNDIIAWAKSNDGN